jgi:hypothetical protein
VRQYEAATFQEWLAAQEDRSRGRGRVDQIGEHQSRAMAWVRASREADQGRIDLLIHPDTWTETDTLLALGLSRLRPEKPVFSLVRDYARPVREHLEAAGFEMAGDYVSLVKRLALPIQALRPRRVAVPALVKPLIAKPLAPAMSAGNPSPDPSPR